MPATVGNVGTPTPGSILVDSSANVFAGTAGAMPGYVGSITEYPSGSSTATTMSVPGAALAIALDGGGNLFAAGCAAGCTPSSAPDSLLEFAPPYTAAAKTIDNGAENPNFGHPTAVAVDSAGNLILANSNYNNLLVYAWPYSVTAQIGSGTLSGPTGLILTP